VGPVSREGLFCPGLCAPPPAHFGSVALPNTPTPTDATRTNLQAGGLPGPPVQSPPTPVRPVLPPSLVGHLQARGPTPSADVAWPSTPSEALVAASQPIRWGPEQSQGHILSVGNAWGARLACYGRFFRGSLGRFGRKPWGCWGCTTCRLSSWSLSTCAASTAPLLMRENMTHATSVNPTKMKPGTTSNVPITGCP